MQSDTTPLYEVAETLQLNHRWLTEGGWVARRLGTISCAQLGALPPSAPLQRL